MALSAPEPLAAEHDVSLFSYGKPALDHVPSKDDPFILYRSIADLAASLAQAQ
ncbi:MAG: hypothetical protein ACREFJ_16210 [Acetobacteraceae bacterium]